MFLLFCIVKMQAWTLRYPQDIGKCTKVIVHEKWTRIRVLFANANTENGIILPYPLPSLPPYAIFVQTVRNIHFTCFSLVVCYYGLFVVYNNYQHDIAIQFNGRRLEVMS